jgi:hypothetical protein
VVEEAKTLVVSPLVLVVGMVRVAVVVVVAVAMAGEAL